MNCMKSLILIVAICLPIVFTSCNDDEIIRESTRTDASVLAEGSYKGSLTDGETTYNDVVVTLIKIADNNIQAVDANVKSASFANLDVTGKLNVANANGVYYLSSGLSDTQKMAGKIDGSNLELNVPLNRKGEKLSNAQTGVVWTFIGVK
jgi:hypothetical protein